MRIKLSRFLLLAGAIGAGIGTCGAYGFGPGIVVTGAITLPWFVAKQTLKRWHEVAHTRRIRLVLTTIASITVAAYLLVAVVTSPTVSRDRLVRSLANEISNQPQFASIHLRHVERERSIIEVTGAVTAEDDFWELNEKLIERNWEEPVAIDWDIWIEQQNGAVDDRQIAASSSDGSRAEKDLFSVAHRAFQRWVFTLR